MRHRVILGSLARNANFQNGDYQIAPLPRESWSFADFLIGEIIEGTGHYCRAELKTGRLVELVRGDFVMGALGTRAATLETCGDWCLIGDDLTFDQMTPAGLFGKETSRNYLLPPMPKYRYVGHVWVDGKPARMGDYVVEGGSRELCTPVVLIIGTSMSAGKTTTAKQLIRQLKEHSVRVVGAKLTGAGRYRDILSMKDAGADEIFDFVDAGLPSTVCPAQQYSEAIKPLLSRIAASEADVLVAEVGASPMEPYNGEAAVSMLKPNLKMSILCASDPYAVRGVVEAFNFRPDLVSGPCTSTESGIALVTRLTGIPAINILSPTAPQALSQTLSTALELDKDNRRGAT